MTDAKNYCKTSPRNLVANRALKSGETLSLNSPGFAFLLSVVRRELEAHRDWSTLADIYEFVEAWSDGDGGRLDNLMKYSAEPIASAAVFALALSRGDGAFDALTARFDAEDASDA